MSVTLYHYTSYAAFCSIISGENLRFTNIGFLNDAMEYQYGIGLFVKAIKNFESKNNIGDVFDISLLNRFTFLNQVYTISFCENGDDLNLWRGYCPKEGGIAIGFNKDTVFSNRNIILNKCHYNNPYDGIIVASNYERIRDKFSKIETLHKDLEHIKFTFDLAHVKSPSFKGENEWRGVTKAENHKIQYFVKNSMIVPFIEYKFIKRSIKEIFIGPSAHQNKIKEALELMTQQFNISCDIIKFKIPFVQY
ncbi:DUF2971 domain-containing protein [Pedobacter aquae]|uniref:DUF2971 domain-containing protein n=1 Tax=Pedobacter aquae TaxID=2605747 RepID=A0A5C0VHY9_9SPHI|nr:DUF2971 domain-containing protein [Pedobacter aquae]QEK51422.1 DUF2971 domain-containing protein [Pedobacter aquae]